MDIIENKINEMRAKADVLEYIKSCVNGRKSSALSYQERANEDEDNAEWYLERSAEESAIADAFLELAKLFK